MAGEFSAEHQAPAWLDRLNALQVEAQNLAARFAAAMTATQQFSARDASGTVDVTVTARGRVEKIRLRSDWRRQLDEHDGLAKAVMDANGNAQREWVNAFAASVAADEPAPRGPDASARPMLSRPAVGPAGGEAQRAMRETFALIEAAQGQLDQAVQAARDHARRECTGHDSGGHVMVRVTGSGDLQLIETDEKFLRRRQPDYVERACEAAFADAYRNADTPPARPAADDAVRELRTLTDDPSALLRRLFGYH
jgi:DNA-binding protein YbaB